MNTAVLVDAKPLKIPRPKLFYGVLNTGRGSPAVKTTTTTPLPDYDDPPASAYHHRMPHYHLHHYQHHRMSMNGSQDDGEPETEAGRSVSATATVGGNRK